MGGLRHTRTAHTARPMALGSAVATLLAALFLCLGQAETAAGTARPHDAHQGFEGLTAAPGTPDQAAYSCPYDRGDCDLFPHLGPAVLTAPPLDSPLAVSGLPADPATAALGGRPPRSGALPRAPDLHVLQVLRT
ncbi:hypothetical protein ACIQMR_01825 [Streptomyces sp. NPDC091376]|uniref:hypothetical protein n=1 Tax=Streptomyces sp. NPDC091376 TaxID=3365994 RepID=UPI00381B8345